MSSRRAVYHEPGNQFNFVCRPLRLLLSAAVPPAGGPADPRAVSGTGKRSSDVGAANRHQCGYGKIKAYGWLHGFIVMETGSLHSLLFLRQQADSGADDAPCLSGRIFEQGGAFQAKKGRLL